MNKKYKIKNILNIKNLSVTLKQFKNKMEEEVDKPIIFDFVF